MNSKITSLLALSVLSIGITISQAQAYPVIDQIVPTSGLPIKVYPDHATPGVYWYIPQSIEPWSRDARYRSALSYKPGKYLTFVFRGQASVDPQILQQVAAGLHTDIRNLAPIAYDTSSNLVCQNVYVGTDVQWVFPGKIGNYLEVVPVSIRTATPNLIEEIHDLIQNGGLACTVDVTFKAVSTSYHLTMTADMNQIYTRFEAAAHAEGFWWEVDAHVLLQNLYREGIIKITKVEDPETAKTDLDKQLSAAWEEIAKNVAAAIFKPALQLPHGQLAGRGKAFSLRVDYVRSTERAHFMVDLNSRNITSKQSQISLRLAPQ